ncbi:MAG: AIR synthase-related protein [Acidobacteriota bacterium]
MRRTFNLGVGFVLCTAAGSADRVLRELESRGENPYVIGELEPGARGVVFR